MMSKNVIFFFRNKKKYRKNVLNRVIICNNAAHDAILCNLGY